MEASQRKMACYGKSTVASVPATVAGLEFSVVHQTQPKVAANIPLIMCKPSEHTLLTGSDQKPPAEDNQPSKFTTHPANPEDVKEMTQQNSSLESSVSLDEVNNAPPRPEECHTLQSMPVDSEGETCSSESDSSTTDSDSSSSEGYREFFNQHLGYLTVPDKCSTTEVSSLKPQTQLNQPPLDSSTSPRIEWEDRTEGAMAVVHEGCVSPVHSSGSADSSYSEEEEEEEERDRPKVGSRLMDVCGFLLQSMVLMPCAATLNVRVCGLC